MSDRRRGLAWGVSLVLAVASGAYPATVTVDITPQHQTNSFSPLRALGAAAGDGRPAGSVDQVYTSSNLTQMLSAGWGAVSYRLNTELQVQDWHWNPTGTWSDPVGQGYWTGATSGSPPIAHSYGYRLPHRGFTHDQAYDEDYSRLVDGDLTTYWKSNPYLTSTFTGESDTLHPQWALVDLGAARPVNAIRLVWANPFATAYTVQYWTGGHAVFDQTDGAWQTFPSGAVSGATGGTVTLTLAPSPISVRFIRILMTASSGTCDTHGSADVRNCVGYALAEVGIGTVAGGGSFTDLVHHVPTNTQTVTYVSSVDPWHVPANQAMDEEQPGLDLFFTSGMTRGLAAMVPVAMAYGTPDDAAAEIRYLKGQDYPIFAVELGEEPDGQFMVPEDYGALYLQWAAALHAVDPTLRLGGPVFQGSTSDITVWPDANGNGSWLSRFLKYLVGHGRLADLGFMSFEHYPFDACGATSLSWSRLTQEPALVTGILEAWANDGLPAGLPVYITEYNVSADNSRAFQDILGALWHADFLGSFLTAGGSGSFLYAYEPDQLSRASACASFGAFSMFTADANFQIRARTAEFFSTQLVTQEWAQPVDAAHDVFPAASDVTNLRGDVLVTAYALHRPDGQWSLLLVNKRPNRAQPIAVMFHNAADNSDHSFATPVTMISFGRANYRWHARGTSGFPQPDGPPVTTSVSGGSGTTYLLPKGSVTVLRGMVP